MLEEVLFGTRRLDPANGELTVNVSWKETELDVDLDSVSFVKTWKTSFFLRPSRRDTPTRLTRDMLRFFVGSSTHIRHTNCYCRDLNRRVYGVSVNTVGISDLRSVSPKGPCRNGKPRVEMTINLRLVVFPSTRVFLYGSTYHLHTRSARPLGKPCPRPSSKGTLEEARRTFS